MTGLGTGTALPPAAVLLAAKSSGGGWVQPELRALRLGLGAGGGGGVGTRRWHELCRGGSQWPEAQDRTEPSALRMGTLPGQRLNTTPQPHSLPIPGQPTPSSIDESDPIYYDKLHLLLPITPTLPHPRPTAPHFPHPLVVAGAPPQAVPCPVSSQPSWRRPQGPGDAEGEAALLLQVDIFCGAGVLHELLVELLERSPRRQADTPE